LPEARQIYSMGLGAANHLLSPTVLIPVKGERDTWKPEAVVKDMVFSILKIHNLNTVLCHYIWHINHRNCTVLKRVCPVSSDIHPPLSSKGNGDSSNNWILGYFTILRLYGAKRDGRTIMKEAASRI
jgi:hypothetical protein